MRTFTFFLLSSLASASLFADSSDTVLRTLDTAPIRFQPGTEAGHFVSRGLRHELVFGGNAISLDGAVRLRFPGANPRPALSGDSLLKAKTNFLVGADKTKWRTNVPSYQRLKQNGIYPGIDLIYYGTERELEYDFVVSPGADAAKIRVAFDGVKARMDSDGRLSVGSRILQRKPVAYQLSDSGERVMVASNYRRNRDGSFGFSLGGYDRAKTLIIDPVLSFSFYLGGTASSIPVNIGHDAKGFLYVAGTTVATDIPLGGVGEQAASAGASDVYLVKLDPTVPSNPIVYTTYFGGTLAESLHAMVVDPQGRVYLAGSTVSTNLPTAGANLRTTLAGTSDAFVAVFDPSQDGAAGLLYSTYLGGATDDSANGIAVDSSGKFYVTGGTTSTDFPLAGGSAQAANAGSADAFISIFDLSQAAPLIYSSYLGGSSVDVGRTVAAASDGTVWIGGQTRSGDFPVAGLSTQPGYNGGSDGFLTHITPATGGSAGLVYSTFLGGSGQDDIKKILIEASTGRVIATGFTTSANFPVTSDALQSAYPGNVTGYVTILDPAQQLRTQQIAYSTFIGGNGGDIPYDVKADSAGNLYLTGYTLSPNFPTTAGAFQTAYDNSLDAFIVKFNPRSGANGLAYGSYIGSSQGVQVGYAVDPITPSTVYVTGYTTASLFGAQGGIPRPTAAGPADTFVVALTSCAYTLSATNVRFPAQGGSATINVTSTPECSYSTTNSLPWLTVVSVSGAGNGTVTLTAVANTTGSQLSGSIVIAGQTFTVTQDAQ